MKPHLLYLLSIVCPVVLCAQAPDIEWQNTIGGSLDDVLYSVSQTSDGGYILGGYSNSTNTGDKIEYGNGDYDYWVVKLDSNSNLVWQNTIGGVSGDFLLDIIPAVDGGYILGGYSVSNVSGDKTEGYIGSNDFWILKLDAFGNIDWQNTIGGSLNDVFSIEQITDGGYILGGSSASGISGDKTEPNIGGLDYWIIKLDISGNIEWQNTIGGNQEDQLTSLQQTTDGGYILGGYSFSGISGDKTEPSMGDADYWIVKLDNTGNILWQKTIGGNYDDKLRSIKQAFDGGFVICGYSNSDASGDKTEGSIGEFGLVDYWVIKTNETGDVEWQNTIGGDMNDIAYDIVPCYTGGYLVGGYSYSDVYGDKTQINWGSSDYWLVRISDIGEIVWQKTIGGGSFDFLINMQITSDGGAILGGYSKSEISGDKTEGNMGPGSSYPDYWVIKLFPEECISPVEFYADADEDGFGNPIVSVSACWPPSGYVFNNTDCNDDDNEIHPDAVEMCNLIDDNCNGASDEGLATFTYYADLDGDTYGNALIDSITCLMALSGYVEDSTDCNDLDNLIHAPIKYFSDTDGDTYGDSLMYTFYCNLLAPSGFTSDSTDCDDTNPDVHPGLEEFCNSVDDNCNVEIDEGLPAYTLYEDVDGDDFGNILIDTTGCLPAIVGYVSDSSDCDDTNSDVYPGAPEIQNGLDDNCNDSIDEGFVGIHNVLAFDFQIYPNPNAGEFYVRTNTNGANTVCVSVYDLVGQLLYTQTSLPFEIIFIELPEQFSGFALVSVNVGTAYIYQIAEIININD